VSYFFKIYRRNIYGIIGTLIFHILLFSAFLLSDIQKKGKIKEEAILIEFPDELLEPENNIIEKEESKEQSEINQSSVNLSNVASNQLSVERSTKSVNEYVDNEYLKEVEAARKLVSDVNNQLSKETVDMDDIKMPVQTTEGMDPDSIKNVIYTGESNIVYYLENRYHVSLPIPVYLSQSGGKVIVDIEVNRNGKVTKAIPRESADVSNDELYNYAKTAASRTIFNSDPDAPVSQKGSIHYNFIAQ